MLGRTTEHPVLVRAIERLARVGEEAEISVDDMIRILNAGVSVGLLLDLIERNRQSATASTDMVAIEER